MIGNKNTKIGLMLVFTLVVGLLISTTGVQAQSKYVCIEKSSGECSSISGDYVSVNIIEADLAEDSQTGNPTAMAMLQVDTSNSSYSNVNLNLDGNRMTVSSETPGFKEVTMIKEYDKSQLTSPSEVRLNINVGTNSRSEFLGKLSNTDVDELGPPEDNERKLTSDSRDEDDEDKDNITGGDQTVIPENYFDELNLPENFSPTKTIEESAILFDSSPKTPPSRYVDSSSNFDGGLENRNIPPYEGESEGQIHDFYNLRYINSSDSSVLTSSSSYEIYNGMAFYSLTEVSSRNLSMEYSLSGVGKFDENVTSPASGSIKIVDAFGDKLGNTERTLVETQSQTPTPAYFNNSVELSGDRDNITINLTDETLNNVNLRSQMYVVVEAENAGAMEIHEMYTEGDTYIDGDS